jgi:hypothetical protein
MKVDFICVGKVNSLAEEVEKSHRDVENQQSKVAQLEAEKAVLALQKRQAEYQITEKNRQDLNQHAAVQESSVSRVSMWLYRHAIVVNYYASC